MPPLLLLDSSLFTGQRLLLWQGDTLVSHYQHNDLRIEPFLPTLAAVWRELTKKPTLYVCSGPGSHTGIRAGRAAMMGLAMGAGLPLQEISAFDLLKAADTAATPDTKFLCQIDTHLWQDAAGTVYPDEALHTSEGRKISFSDCRGVTTLHHRDIVANKLRLTQN